MSTSSPLWLQQVASGTGQSLPVNVFVQGQPISSVEKFSYALPEVTALLAAPLGIFDSRTLFSMQILIELENLQVKLTDQLVGDILSA